MHEPDNTVLLKKHENKRLPSIALTHKLQKKNGVHEIAGTTIYIQAPISIVKCIGSHIIDIGRSLNL